MNLSIKPIGKCYTCLLNLGDTCWLYRNPRGQWRSTRKCAAFENEDVYTQYRRWRREPTVKTRKELRREAFRSRRKATVRRERRGSGTEPASDVRVHIDGIPGEKQKRQH